MSRYRAMLILLLGMDMDRLLSEPVRPAELVNVAMKNFGRVKTLIEEKPVKKFQKQYRGRQQTDPLYAKNINLDYLKNINRHSHYTSCKENRTPSHSYMRKSRHSPQYVLYK